MNNLVENLVGAASAGAYYFKSAVSLAVKNPVFLGITVLMLLSGGKSIKIGKSISAKG